MRAECQCGCGEVFKTSPSRHQKYASLACRDKASLGKPKVPRPAPVAHNIDGRHCWLIPLTKGKFAIVSSEDVDRISLHKWSARECKNDVWYAVRSFAHSGKVVLQGMHNLISGCSGPDHIDGNGLNNQRNNLRPATVSQNNANRRVHNPIGYRGVRRNYNRFNAYITHEYKQYHLGSFLTKEEAAIAYNLKAIELYGDFAFQNRVPDHE